MLALVLGLAVTSRTAHAQDSGVEQARAHFETGQDLFEKGEFQKAADEFMAAYAAKPFAAFLFNAAVCYERLKDYPKAIELFKKYLTDDPQARDKTDVEARITTLEAEVVKGQTPVDPNVPPPVDGQQPPEVVLPEVKTKGLIVIESKPPGATIYLDTKKKGALLGTTPWNGSIDGEHTIILESKGYKTEKKKVTPSPDKLVYLYFALSEEHYLGYLEVRSNIPHAEVFIDRKEDGSVGTAPWLGNIRPGKHTIWVTKEGYTEAEETLTVEAGKAHKVNLNIEMAPIGFVRVRGNESVEGARVKLDGKEVCKSVPCRLQAPEGKHKLSVSRGGKKTMSKTITIERATETTLNVRMANTPSHTDAILPLVLGAGAVVGGYFLMQEAGKQEPDSDEEKYFTWGSYAAYGAGGLFVLQGLWYLVRDKGPPSTATIESREITWAPAVGPGYAGVGGLVRF